jgi:hypothetical protein
MSTVRTCLDQKPDPAVVFSVGLDDKIVTVPQQINYLETYIKGHGA